MIYKSDLLIEVEDTAADTDVFSGTDIANPDFDGTALLWMASTVNTATVEVNAIGHKPGNTVLLRKRTDGIPSLQDDPCFKIPIKKGSGPKVVLGGTTGTVHSTMLVFWKR